MGCLKTLKTKIKQTIFPPGMSPLDLKFIVTIFFTSVGNSMVITMPFSFLPSMIESFGFEKLKVGYYAGLAASSLYAGRVIGSYLWGWLCDRFGTRKTLIISTFLLMVQTLLFGLSKSFEWAVITRLGQGAVGGVIICLKAHVFRVCDETNNSLAYAIILGSFQFGIIIGPAVGGFLVFPSQNYPNLFPKHSLLDTYPFLLPLLVNASILAVSLVLIYFFIQAPPRHPASEKTSLVESLPKKSNSNEYTMEYTQLAASDHIGLDESFLVLSAKFAASNDDMKFLSRSQNGGKETISYFRMEKEKGAKRCCTSCCNFIRESSFVKLMRIKPVVMSVLLYGFCSFINTGCDELFPIFANSPREYGGLGFTTSQIGIAVLIPAFPMIFLLMIFAKVDQKFGSRKMSLAALYGQMLIIPLFPYIGAFNGSKVWFALVPGLFCMRFFITVSFYSANILLNASADPEYVGAVNGIGMSISSIFRMISPSILGSLYSWSLTIEYSFSYPLNHCFSFVLCGFLALLILPLAAFFPDDKLKNRKIKEITNEPSSESQSNNPEIEV